MVFLNENSKLKKKIKADAIITNQKKLPIAVLTADCVPVLLYDYEKKIIAAIHAGWKGAYRGIVRNVINFMHKKGCNPKNIIGAIGPSITQKNYEVKADFKKKFIKKHKKNKIFFKGYAFQIQLKFIGSKLGFKVKEIPIIFKDREIGDSKMSMNIPGEAFFGVIYMKVLSLFKKHRR